MYGYFRSSCSGRVRIALFFKGIDFHYIPINIKDGFHLAEDYARLNPSKTVPTLFITDNPSPITQSVAALEYLEEAYPTTPALLPQDSFSKAQVRSLVQIITADVQPVTNLRILKKVSSHEYDPAKWSREYHAAGFEAFETIVATTAGKYAFGDEITLADICLAPAVWNAERWGLDLSPYPTVRRVYANASQHEAFRRGHWKQQIDCPETLRTEGVV